MSTQEEKQMAHTLVQAYSRGIPLLVSGAPNTSRNGIPVPNDQVEGYLEHLKAYANVDAIRVARAYDTLFPNYQHPEVTIPEGTPPLDLAVRCIRVSYITRNHASLEWESELAEDHLLRGSGCALGPDTPQGQAQMKADLLRHIEQSQQQAGTSGMSTTTLNLVQNIHSVMHTLSLQQVRDLLLTLLPTPMSELELCTEGEIRQALMNLVQVGTQIRTELESTPGQNAAPVVPKTPSAAPSVVGLRRRRRG